MGKLSCLIIVLLLFNPIFGHSTTFLPYKSKVLFTEIEGWVSGEIIDITYKKGFGNKIYTVLSISLTEFSGIPRSKISNPNNFKVHFPGGKWQGNNYYYSGSPHFKKHDKYYFLINRKTGGYYVAGFSAGAIQNNQSNATLIDELRLFSKKKFQEIRLVGGELKSETRMSSNPRTVASAVISDTQNFSQGYEDVSIILVVFVIFLLIFFFLFIGRNEGSNN